MAGLKLALYFNASSSVGIIGGG